MSNPRLVLASASPRRAALLRALGIPHLVRPTDVDESLVEGEDARQAGERLARAKARAAASDPESRELPVLAADTLVTLGGEILGKPRDGAQAEQMLARLSGVPHQVVTGVCLAHRGRLFSAVEVTEVRFAPMSAQEIRWYVSTGEPLDKAGAYHVDGIGALFVESVSGSPSNVEGLPVRLVARLARQAGVPLF